MSPQLEDSFFRAVFGSNMAGIAVGDLASQSVVEVNLLLLEILGRRREEIVGVPFAWREVTPPEYHHLDERALRQVAKDGHSDPFEKEYVRPDGSRVPVLVSTSMVPGFAEKFIIFVSDLSAERGREAALTETEARFRIMADSAHIMMWVNGPDGGCEFVNQAYLDFFGKRLEEVLDCGWAPAAHPDDAERYVTSYLAAVERRSPFAAEARFMRSDGEYRWVRSTGVARISLDGEYLGHTGITQDISDRKQWERHQQLLVAELNHRVKNTLAVVQSLARQSFMPEKPPLESVGAYEGRLSALAAAHNLLTRENWDAAALDELIELAVSPFCSGSRCTIEGPPLRVAPQTAVTIALAMHELATNASKYGALSKSSGAPSIKSRSFVQQQ